MVEPNFIKKVLIQHAKPFTANSDQMQSLPVVVNKYQKPKIPHKSPFDSVFMLNDDSEEDIDPFANFESQTIQNKIPLTQITPKMKKITLETTSKIKVEDTVPAIDEGFDYVEFPNLSPDQ